MKMSNEQNPDGVTVGMKVSAMRLRSKDAGEVSGEVSKIRLSKRAGTWLCMIKPDDGSKPFWKRTNAVKK